MPKIWNRGLRENQVKRVIFSRSQFTDQNMTRGVNSLWGLGSNLGLGTWIIIIIFFLLVSAKHFFFYYYFHYFLFPGSFLLHLRSRFSPFCCTKSWQKRKLSVIRSRENKKTGGWGGRKSVLRRGQCFGWKMGVEETSPLQERSAPITTSAVLMAASKHIASKCGAQNRAFLDCKRNDPDPERCLRQGQDVTGCVISL